jgi:hypothetical protein
VAVCLVGEGAVVRAEALLERSTFDQPRLPSAALPGVVAAAKAVVAVVAVAAEASAVRAPGILSSRATI